MSLFILKLTISWVTNFLWLASYIGFRDVQLLIRSSVGDLAKSEDYSIEIVKNVLKYLVG